VLYIEVQLWRVYTLEVLTSFVAETWTSTLGRLQQVWPQLVLVTVSSKIHKSFVCVRSNTSLHSLDPLVNLQLNMQKFILLGYLNSIVTIVLVMMLAMVWNYSS
jgi:hypothetical protein